MMGGLLELPRERGLGEGWSLRLLTAREEMECRREGLGMPNSFKRRTIGK